MLNTTQSASPSKYYGELLLTERLWESIDQSWEEDFASREGMGYAVLVKGPIELDGLHSQDGLTEDDAKLASRVRYVILYESDSGFVSGTWYTNKRTALRDWRAISRDLSWEDDDA